MIALCKDWSATLHTRHSTMTEEEKIELLTNPLLFSHTWLFCSPTNKIFSSLIIQSSLTWHTKTYSNIDQPDRPTDFFFFFSSFLTTKPQYQVVYHEHSQHQVRIAIIARISRLARDTFFQLHCTVSLFLSPLHGFFWLSTIFLISLWSTTTTNMTTGAAHGSDRRIRTTIRNTAMTLHTVWPTAADTLASQPMDRDHTPSIKIIVDKTYCCYLGISKNLSEA